LTDIQGCIRVKNDILLISCDLEPVQLAYLPAVVFHAYMISSCTDSRRKGRKKGRRKERKILTSDTAEPISAYTLAFLTELHYEMYVHWIGLQEILDCLDIPRRGILLIS
jgi:hypothetical protein